MIVSTALLRSGRRIAEMFKEVPDKKDYPEYYEIIKQPIALDIIKVDYGRSRNT